MIGKRQGSGCVATGTRHNRDIVAAVAVGWAWTLGWRLSRQRCQRPVVVILFTRAIEIRVEIIKFLQAPDLLEKLATEQRYLGPYFALNKKACKSDQHALFKYKFRDVNKFQMCLNKYKTTLKNDGLLEKHEMTSRCMSWRS